MKLNSVSAPSVANHTMSYHHALQSVHFSGFIHSKVKVNHPITITNSRTSCTIQWLAVNRISLTKSRTIPFAIPNENDRVEGDLVRGLVEDNKLHSECDENEGSNLSEAEVETSVSGVDFDSVVEVLGREGSVLDKLKAIQLHMLASEQWNASKLQLCHRNYLDSATNLIHYLALRCLDVEKLKDDLSMIGLLNLEYINPHVLPSLTASIQVLENLTSKNISGGVFADEKLSQQTFAPLTIQKMRNKAFSNRKRLLGLPEDGRTTHIMVTVGEEATKSEALITDLIKAGTSVIRINCAHGSPSIWSEIIKRVKESSQMLEKPCRILMDLAGPKLRTGKFKLGPSVKKISPQRTATGHVMFPAQVWLSHEEAGPPSPHLSLDAVLVVDNQEFFTKLDVGDTLRFSDARGKWRGFKISRKFHVFSGTGFVAECTRTAYVQSGTRLFIKGKKSKSPAGVVVDVPLTDLFVRIRIGDRLIISRGNASKEEELSVSSSGIHRITCSSGYLFDSVKPGDPIAFDDGKIWGVIQGTSGSEIVVSITHASPRGTKLGSDKSINIPASEVQFEGLTSKDLIDLEFVANNADIVGISFVRDVSDIVVLRRELENRKLENLGIVLKIETKRGFEKLPLLLLEAMKSPNPVGVMIARGDLAVECGWEKLAEMQEEIIALCDAAHIPIIWATQVLESLVKTGVPTRAEITDAANGRRVSCVMLNKGQNITQAVSTLDNILRSNSRKMKTDLQSIFLSGHLS